MPRTRYSARVALGTAIALVLLLASSPCFAQRLLRPRLNADAGPEIDAIAGSPLGVGKLTVQLPAGTFVPALSDNGFTLREKDGRALYQAFDAPPIRTLLRNVLERPQRITVYFLFTGDEPLSLDFFAPTSIPAKITPRRDPAAHDQLLNLWWREYLTAARRAHSEDAPPMVDDYLTSMLSRRLNLQPPGDEGGLLERFTHDPAGSALGTLMGAESVRVAMQKDTMLRKAELREPADQPLPKPIGPVAVELPEPPKDVAIEPIAMHVPVESFYLRCGGFNNYRWFRMTLDEWGGDLRNLISVRGVDYGLNDKLERQLALKENALAKFLGPQVIADVALIGDDPFLREGAAIGMLFQAKSNFALSSDIKQQRAAALEREKGATNKTIEIAGHEVSFLSTPDNTLRSFYAVDGDYHLVTTSQTMVRRFFEAGKGQDALGASREFRHARTVMPLDRDDTVFVYLSDEFFRNLLSPQYRIEMTRRLQAATDIDLLNLARYAAKAEHRPADSLAALVQGGFLPPGFGQTSDGSGPVLTEGVSADTLRGGRGSFVPVPDVTIDRATATEVKAYAEFGQKYHDEWERMDPVMVGIRRTDGGAPGLEHVVLDIHMSPFAKQHYGFLAGMLGQPTTQRLSPIGGDAVTLEVVLGDRLGGADSGGHLYGGLRDSEVDYQVVDGVAVPLGSPDKQLKYYAGAWPPNKLLQFLGYKFPDPNQAGAEDSQGFAHPSADVWQRTKDGFGTISNRQDVLEIVTSQLKVVESPRAAQVRLHVGDPADQKMTKFVNALAYFRAKQTSLGNVRLLHTLQAQLHVPADKAMDVAQGLLDGRLVCALGGKYELQQPAGELPHWVATAVPARRGLLDLKPPDDYRSPPLQWFRGLDLDFALLPDNLSAHVELDMQRKVEPGVELPSLPTTPKPVEKKAPEKETLPPPTPPQENKGGKVIDL